MKKILIVEDDSSIRKLLKYDLKALKHEVLEAANGSEGIELVKSNEFDLIITDCMMPVMDGKEFVKQLRELQKSTYCIMLTAVDDEFNKLELFELGVDDYITKPFSQRELMARIKRVFERTEVKSEVIIHKNLKLDLKQYIVYEDDEIVKFTKTDFKLLRYLLENKGNVVTRDQILNAVWGYNYVDTTRVVDVHIHSIRDKFKQKVVKTVRGIGYTIV